MHQQSRLSFASPIGLPRKRFRDVCHARTMSHYCTSPHCRRYGDGLSPMQCDEPSRQKLVSEVTPRSSIFIVLYLEQESCGGHGMNRGW